MQSERHRSVLVIDPRDPTPIYAQLDRAIRAEIASGKLRGGDRLPTVRQLAIDLHINANTVAKVYAELERRGVLSTQRGVGTFVRQPDDSSAAKLGPEERDRMLQQMTVRLLAEASGTGITLDEIIQYLEGRRTQDNA